MCTRELNINILLEHSDIPISPQSVRIQLTCDKMKKRTTQKNDRGFFFKLINIKTCVFNTIEQVHTPLTAEQKSKSEREEYKETFQ